jgi:hypothetical protein
MLTSVLPAPDKRAAPAMEKTASAAKASLAAKTTSLWERMMAASSRSFELLAESKCRFPMDT